MPEENFKLIDINGVKVRFYLRASNVINQYKVGATITTMVLAHSVHGIIGVPGKTSQLNPLFVAEMMGFPENWTELPFLVGEKNQLNHTETQ